MNALITGDTGFIGRNLRRFLEGKGVQVTGYSKSFGADIFDFENLAAQVEDCDIVFHCAAEAKPGESVLKPVHTINININGSLNVLEACKKHSVPLVYPSSCEIYGNSNGLLEEKSPLNPTNPYAASKAAIDRFCYMYHHCYGLDVKIMRFFNPYGPYQQLTKIIPTFYFKAVKGEPLPVFGDGTDTRDYVYIDDIVRGLWLARNLPSGEAINLATEVATTNLDVARMIIDITNSKSKIEFLPYPRAFGGIKRQVGSYIKAKEFLGWEPQIKLEKGIPETITWLKNVKLN
jgi:nucleoside-diphosphate-sugar epimerase